MKIIFNPTSIDQKLAVALGNFDGVHLGHQAIIAQAKKFAKDNSLPASVITFEPHPVKLFRPESSHNRIADLKGKIKLLEEQGIENCYILKFNKSFSQLTADEFINRYIKDSFVVTGNDFSFGSKRQGNTEILKSVFGDKYYSSEIIGGISSSKIRDALRAGDVREANKMLGHHYTIRGNVVSGDAKARELGFPTANIRLKRDLLRAKYGVYAVSTQYGRGVANFGVRPTLDGTKELLEVHIFDFEKNIYGQALEVKFIDYIREERKFASFDDLANQIKLDSKIAREICSKEE